MTICFLPTACNRQYWLLFQESYEQYLERAVRFGVTPAKHTHNHSRCISYLYTRVAFPVPLLEEPQRRDGQQIVVHDLAGSSLFCTLTDQQVKAIIKIPYMYDTSYPIVNIDITDIDGQANLGHFNNKVININDYLLTNQSGSNHIEIIMDENISTN